MSVKQMLLACVFAPLAIGAARAEDWQPSPKAVVPLATPAPSATSASVDGAASPSATADGKGPELNALRYYAHSRDLNRVAAEIRRIKLDYPNWNPPEDLYSEEKARVDEQPLWDLYLKKDYAGIDAKIAEMKQATPDWTPTHDFTDKYAHAKASAEVIAKSDAKQWTDVVDVATKQAGLVNCNEIDLAWRIAEGFARTGDEAKATDIYAFLLNSCANQPARLGTVQKASEVLTDTARVDQLIALGKKKPDGTNEFAAIVDGRMRADIGEIAAGSSTSAAPAERIAAFEKLATADKKPEDALLLGWYYRKIGDHEKALAWTRIAYQGEANPKSAEAYALALRESYHFDDAEKLTYEWRDKGDQFRKLYIDIVSTSITAHGHDAEIMRRQSEQETQTQVPVQKELSGSKGDVYGQAFDRPMVYCGPQQPLTPPEIERLMRFKVEVEADKSALGAQALGWRLYEGNRPTDAALWFEHSMVWAPNAPAAVGLAVTAKRMHQLGVYRALLAKFGGTYPELMALNGKQRGCATATAGAGVVTSGGGVAAAAPPSAGLFASVFALEVPAAPAAGAKDGLASQTVPPAPATGAIPTTAPAPAITGDLTPSDVNPTEIRAAAETPAPTYERHHRLHRRATPRFVTEPELQLEPQPQPQLYRGLFGG